MYLVANPQPAILTCYLRHYYATNDHKIRTAIDTQQSVYVQRYKPYLNTELRTNVPETTVLEIKFSRRDRDRAASLIQGLPIRVSRNSRYVIGLISAHGL
jgi:hypothetical protein